MTREIRAARAGDERAITALHARCIGDAFVGKYAPPDTERDERQRSWTGPVGSPHARHALLLAERTGGVVGLIAVGPSREDSGGGETVGELRVILIDAGERGHGLGAALLDAGERAMSESGFLVATLWVLPENTRAIRCYERGGWRADGVKRAADFGGRELTSIRYEKQLG